MSKAAELAALIGSQTALSNRNLIINGAMQVWQRGTTIDTITSGDYLCDRWRLAHGGTDGNVDVDRSTDVPSGQGFAYSQKISMDASETSLDADDQVNLQQRFEGQNLQQILKGTSSAKSLTLSFWVKSSVASTYSVNLRDNDNTRVIASTYVINAANTWEKKTITFAGDTTGALDNNNARSLDLTFYMDAGTSFTGGTFASSWGDASNNNVRVSATTGWLESTSPEWYITGVQLEVGEQATPFEHRSFGEELALCKRYFQKSYLYETAVGTTDAGGMYLAQRFNTSDRYFPLGNSFPQELRTTPALTIYDRIGNESRINQYNGQDVQITISSINGRDAKTVARYLDNNSGSGSDAPQQFHWEADSEL